MKIDPSIQRAFLIGRLLDPHLTPTRSPRHYSSPSITFVPTGNMHGFFKILALMATSTALVQAGPVKTRAGGVSLSR